MKEIYIKNVNGEHSLVCETPYVLSARNIEDAMKNLYNMKVDDLADLFWEGNYANDCYKALHFRDGNQCWPNDTIYDFDSETEKERCKFRNAVRHFLDDYIEERYPYEYILVDVSW